MKDPVRWADAASDVDPVLRTVMRYAQRVEPSPEDIASIAIAADRARPAPEAEAVPRDWPRQVNSWLRWRSSRLYWGLGVALAAAAGWFVVSTTRSPSPAPGLLVTPEVLEHTAVPAPPAVAPPVTSATPRPVGSAPAAEQRQPRAVPSSAPSAPRTAGDLALLTEARHELGPNPERTLDLLAAHRQAYPRSAFAEERTALQIEALYALGRSDEAERDYARFVARFPGSIYAPRLTAVREHHQSSAPESGRR